MTYKSQNKFYINDSVLREKLIALNTHQHYKNRKLKCATYSNALVQPFKMHNGKFGGGVLTEKDEQIPNTGYHEHIHEKYPYNPSEVIQRHEAVLYIGCIYQCWGHLFTDCFAKLWYLQTDEYKHFSANGGKVIYITKDNKPLPQYVYDLFDIADVDLRPFEHITSHTRFENILIPDNSFYLQLELYERMFTDEYLSLIDNIRQKFVDCKGNYPEKLYLSRTKLCQDKRDYGEKQIERFMKKAGYTIFYPEQHTVAEQIDNIVHCSFLAATEGSVSLNSIFCQPNTELLVIKKGAYTNGYQAAVADAANLRVTYVDAYKSTYNNKLTPWVGPFFIYPNRNLQKSLGISGNHCLFFNMEWWRYIKDNNKISKLLKLIYRRFNSLL